MSHAAVGKRADVSWHDLPPSAFPFTIELVREDTGEVVWTQRVAGPGAIKIPGVGFALGVTVFARMTWPDGEVFEEKF